MNLRLKDLSHEWASTFLTMRGLGDVFVTRLGNGDLLFEAQWTVRTPHGVEIKRIYVDCFASLKAAIVRYNREAMAATV